MIFLATLLLAASPYEDVLVERCDAIEHNRFYDEEGVLQWSQVIFYDSVDNQWVVRAWRLVKSDGMLPELDHKRNEYRVLWLDGLIMREVRAPIVRETWTQFDPELDNRMVVPKEKRRELRTK